MIEETVPFNVTDEVAVGDLTDVTEQRQLVPATDKVKMRITKAAPMQNKDKDLKGLKLELRIVDGIETRDSETGETKLAYRNKPLFTGIMDLCYWANPETRTNNWFSTRQHLVGFKKFCKALGMDLKNVRVNDEFFEAIIQKEILVDIQHEEESILDPETNERKKTGTFRERLRNWAPVS